MEIEKILLDEIREIRKDVKEIRAEQYEQGKMITGFKIKWGFMVVVIASLYEGILHYFKSKMG